jgi:hypothetical protein
MPFNEAILDAELAILFGCNFLPTFIEVNILPNFQSTDYMFMKNREKGNEDWEV